MANSRAVTTLDEALKYTQSRSLRARKILGGIQIFADPIFESSLQATVFKKAVSITPLNGQWNLETGGLQVKSFGLFEEALSEGERCLDNETYAQKLWDSARDVLLSQQKAF
jgi:hypothetical protein